MELYIPIAVAMIPAVAAIVAPVITAVINARTSLRIKKMDMMENGIRKSVETFCYSYIQLPDADDLGTYWSFRSAGYSLMSQCNHDKVHEHVLAVINSVKQNANKPNAESDCCMESLMQSLATYTASV